MMHAHDLDNIQTHTKSKTFKSSLSWLELTSSNTQTSTILTWL